MAPAAARRGQPCAPAIAFQLGDDSAAARVLAVRGMLRQGFLISSQLYVMWPHNDPMIASMLSALDEVLSGLDGLHGRGALRAEAGPTATPTGFARLA